MAKKNTPVKENQDKRMTLKEIAVATGASYRTVAAYAKQAGWTENGKQTLLTEGQVTAMLEAMKQPASSGTKSNLASRMQGIETSQSRIMRLKILQEQMEAIYEAEIKDLRAQNKVMKPKADYYDALVATDGLTNFRDTAKELKVSLKRFVEILLKKKYLYRDDKKELKPCADKMQFFEVKDFAKDGYVGHQTLITIKGKEHFRKMLEKENMQNDSTTPLLDHT